MENLVREKLEFFKNKKILVTGHTGFKGSWLTHILLNAGAILTGYALEAPTFPSIYKVTNLESKINSVIGDIRDFEKLLEVFKNFEPEIVFHLAAQPLVRDSYSNPRYTFETNIMGTVNILECIRKTSSVKSFINVTTDKVYKNNEWLWGYRENDALNGFDPYSNSKSCSELVTQSYDNSFFKNRVIAVSTVRAGNVIGGGDFANDRIIPDCIRFASENKDIVVRNPYSVRPYQHVLEPLFAYILIAKRQYENISYAGNYNIGPDDKDCISTGKLVDLFCQKWNLNFSKEIKWINSNVVGPHEAGLLKLDCSKIKSIFLWKPTWGVEMAIQKTIDFYDNNLDYNSINTIVYSQIEDFLKSIEYDFD